MSAVFDQVFVLYPRGLQTGGPEALHQLVHQLRSDGQSAFLVPIEGTADRPRAEQFRKYDAPEAPLLDRPGNAVVAPETALTSLRGIRNAQPVCWWLSVDNSMPFIIEQERRDREFANLQNIRHKRWAPSMRILLERRVVARYNYARLFSRAFHIAQSVYARAFLQTHLGICAAIVSDYIPRVDSDLQDDETGSFGRSHSIAYNPAKAPWIPSLLRPHMPDVTWSPLAGLDRSGVVRLLRESGAYFDPGFHPGRDRMPREAAMLHTPVVVARRGAAAYWDDVPVGAEFKVSAGREFVSDASSRLLSILNDPDGAAERQAGYRQWIGNDQERFAREVRRAFRDGRWEDDMPVLPARV